MSGSARSDGRVVVGVDGSSGSLAALDFAFGEAQRRATGLLVVAAFELPDVWSLTYGLPVSCTLEEIEENMLQNTRRLVTEALGDRMTAHDAPDVDIVTRGGGAAHVLADFPAATLGGVVVYAALRLIDLPAFVRIACAISSPGLG